MNFRKLAFLLVAIGLSAAPAGAIDLTSVLPGLSSDSQPSSAGDAEIFKPSDSDQAINAERLASITKRLNGLAGTPLDEVAASNGVTADDVKDRISLLNNLKLSYERIAATAKNIPGAEAQLQALKSVPEENALPKEKPPFDIATYERALDESDDLAVSQELKEADLRNAKLALSYAQSSQQAAESSYRSAKSTPAAASNAWKMENLALTAEAARADVLLRQLLIKQLTAESQSLAIQINSANKKTSWIESNLKFTEEDYRDILKSLDANAASLQNKLQEAEREAPTAAAPQSDSQDPTIKELADSLSSQKKSFTMNRIERLHAALARLAACRQMWDQRYKLFNGGVQQENMPVIIDSLGKNRNSIESAQASQQKLMLAVQKRLSSLNDQTAGKQGGEAQELKKQMIALTNAELADLDADAASIASLLRLTSRTLQEYKARYNVVPVTEKVAGMWKVKTAEILNTELWTSGDYTVHLKSLLGALVILLLGVFGSHRATRFVMKWVRRRAKIDETTAATISRFVLYLLFFICFLIALKLVSIPLTAFAFLGGAFAIAIGFGAQTLFTNVISGIMLAVNRPFRLGDTLEIDDVLGEVKEIGTRSTRLKTPDGRDVVVPNSKLLDSRLINWNLTDYLNRRTITIGLSYDSDPNKAIEVMNQVVRTNPQVLPYPEPAIYFSAFGDSSLNLTIYYWVNLRVASGLKVDSDVRLALFKALSESGLAIPFPRVDVSLLGGALPQQTSPVENGRPNS